MLGDEFPELNDVASYFISIPGMGDLGNGYPIQKLIGSRFSLQYWALAALECLFGVLGSWLWFLAISIQPIEKDAMPEHSILRTLDPVTFIRKVEKP